MLQTILHNCDFRYRTKHHENCHNCSYSDYCPHDCEKCLDYIHTPSRAPAGAPNRKYNCTNMADFYTCKYSCRYSSEIAYALNHCRKLHTISTLKVLSLGCGPCTDLFAIDYLHSNGCLSYTNLEYYGIDYSQNVWKNIHSDIKQFDNNNRKIRFSYKDICDFITTLSNLSWIPNLIIFQYVFSDLKKHTDNSKINNFINSFAQYYNSKIGPDSYIILNDINLGNAYNGGRDYFEILNRRLLQSSLTRGHFRNDAPRPGRSCPHGYPYGDEFPNNTNYFDFSQWNSYSPFQTCASAQMIIRRI